MIKTFKTKKTRIFLQLTQKEVSIIMAPEQAITDAFKTDLMSMPLRPTDRIKFKRFYVS